ncbi:class I SAM-dependent methyltransferase [Alteromonas aestuariivivens]|uniref:Class I SAM-dependent methyltransferase n=1 Tax=Alteromonas aestuariivivens TaxID=1938339 RepID=A0A3D8M5A7_9ALTE|nr:class I SAM-dependent methyltransferase [Alteromonas aestuariivivens]RDV24770.1 class I SAM-dependent methyltransferase [Alteromonas aestuariivivens]
MPLPLSCPLGCANSECTPYAQDKRRHYAQCPACKLVFVYPDYLPSAEQERLEYELHENHSDDPGYRKFLMRLAMPLLNNLRPASRGLDFGCGPTPLLARIFEEDGHSMAIYDPFFFPDDAVLNGPYDFITCTEAIEHFHHPARELARLDRLLSNGGWLAIMTKRVISQDRFQQWHYKNDPTHVCFFSDETFLNIGQQFGYEVHFVENDVVLMQKIP